MLGYPVSEIVWLVLCILAGGVVTGILAGLFGIGGGGVIVPVLYEVFGVMHVPDTVRMQLCIGTSLAIIVPTTVRSYVAHKKRGQAAHLGIGEDRKTPFGNGTDFRQRQRDLIGGKRHGLGVEIAAGDHFIGLGKHQRIIGDGIGLDLQGAAGKTQQIQHCSHHLRLATQRIGILHAVATDMRLPDRASRKQPAQSARNNALPFMPAQLVQPIIERRIAALERIGRKRA